MKTLTVQEASESLSDWLRRAASGEQIAIAEGSWVVLLQPLSVPQDSPGSERATAREALRRLQSGSRLTASEADNYLRDVRAERLADGEREDS
jgi:antitoxin (DNA-binding transcriptional repressor) of toxin-antitoxin stability system